MFKCEYAFCRHADQRYIRRPSTSSHDYWLWDLQNGDGLDGKQSLADLSVTVALCILTECQYFGQRCCQFDVTDVNIKAIMHRKQRPGASISLESFIEMPTYLVFECLYIKMHFLSPKTRLPDLGCQRYIRRPSIMAHNKRSWDATKWRWYRWLPVLFFRVSAAGYFVIIHPRKRNWSSLHIKTR